MTTLIKFLPSKQKSHSMESTRKSLKTSQQSSSLIVLVIAILVQFDNNVASAEYFSSVDSLKKLGDVELRLNEAFLDYLKIKENELESYNRFIEDIKKFHKSAAEDKIEYLSNPINGFKLIKRTAADWHAVHENIKQSLAQTGFKQSFEKINEELQLPDNNELIGAVKGLVRLQKAYKLEANDLTRGKINGHYTGTQLTWQECFEIATNLFDIKEFPFALVWFETTINMLSEVLVDGNDDPISLKYELDVLEYLAITNNKLSNTDAALEYIEEILELSPTHHIKNFYEYLLYGLPHQPQPIKPPDIYTSDNNYTRLCRGLLDAAEPKDHFKCTLETRDNPHFILSPLKVEHLNEDPEIKIFHGILSHKQIDKILAQTSTEFERSKVMNGTTSILSDIRVSQQAWLPLQSQEMKSLYYWVGQVTGFDMKNSEPMQMANYGIGGQYEPHHDFIGAHYNDERWIGDRISTSVIYLSDVEQGGYTVFPQINIYARPVKGSMVSWHNLHKSLKPDYRTYHAGCPVLHGSKRIGNIWIHSGFQEFRRPCGLETDN